MMRFWPLIVIGTMLSCAAYADDPIVWGYGDNDGDEDEWGELSKDWAACEIGHKQSPVRLSYAETADLPALAIHYHPSKATVRIQDKGLQILVKGDNHLIDGKHDYVLKKIMLHSPAEHLPGDKLQLVEMQFLHEDAQGKMLILSVFANEGDASAALKPVTDAIHGKTIDSGSVAFDPAGLLPSQRGYYAYTGSLTTPPCTEGVEWRLMKTAIGISREQLVAITGIVGRNARRPQPIYLRHITQTKE